MTTSIPTLSRLDQLVYLSGLDTLVSFSVLAELLGVSPIMKQ